MLQWDVLRFQIYPDLCKKNYRLRRCVSLHIQVHINVLIKCKVIRNTTLVHKLSKKCGTSMKLEGEQIVQRLIN